MSREEAKSTAAAYVETWTGSFGSRVGPSKMPRDKQTVHLPLGGLSLAGSLLENLPILLLGLHKGILEGVCVCAGCVSRQSRQQHLVVEPHLLSELANRMARVRASGSPSLTSAAAFHTQLRSEPTLGESFISGTTAQSGAS